MSKGMRTLALITILVISLSFVYAECIPNEKISDSNTINDVKFSTIFTSFNQETSEYIQTIQVLNKANSVKNIDYTKYSCRCQKTIGNGDNKICIAYWPDDLFNCQGIEESLSLNPGETEIIEISVSQYKEKLCGTYQTDLWINSINGENKNKLSVWALAHLCEDCIEDCEEQSCLITNNTNSIDVFLGNDDNAKELQQVLDDSGLGLDALLDQKNYQFWDMSNKKQVTLKIDYLFGNTNQNNIVGYYLDDNIFVPLTNLKSLGTQTITVSDTSKIGFAVKNIGKNLILRTENNKNADGKPYAVVYDSCSGWIVGFEDLPNQNYDYQDAVIRVRVLGCEDKCVPTKEICDGQDNNCNGEIDEGGDSLCDNGIGCDGLEVCLGEERCQAGEQVDCSIWNIPGIDTCFNIPDSNDLTFDFRTEFISECNELGDNQFECTTGNEEITHECDLNCGAECYSENSCSQKEGNKTFYDTCDEKMLVDYNDNNELDNKTITASCSRDCNLNSCGCGDCELIFEDLIPQEKCVLGICGAECSQDSDCEETVCESGCQGNDWYEYSNVPNSCVGCACEQNECSAPIIYPNDERCVECTIDEDCSNLTREYCSGEVHMQDSGVCIDYNCEVVPSEIEDCSLKDGINNDCGVFEWTCSEELNRVECVIDNIRADDSLCLDDLGCNGLEYCDGVTYTCQAGEQVDCSIWNIPGIDSCDNNPDNNPFTIDLRDEFISECIEPGICTQENRTLTHECDLNCGAECDSSNLCSDKEGNKTFYDSCDEKMLVDYNDNEILDNETITASCSRDCNLNSCGCGDCDLTFQDLVPETECVLGICGATCSQDSDCEETICGDSGCVGNDYYEYSNLPNSCDDCSCTQNQCGEPIISYNDERCGECDDDSDCSNLTREYCSEDNDRHMIDNGVCISNMCEIDSSVVEDCSLENGLQNQCGLLEWTCSEEINQVECVIDEITPDDSLCSDDSGCNGQETCNDITFRCEAGEQVDCSVWNIPGISSCFNIPDENDLTFDFRTAFTSQCQDLQQGGFQCTTGNEDITHECDLQCGAECSQDSDCLSTACPTDGCVENDYYEYTGVENECIGCLCEENECILNISYNDPRCEQCIPGTEICNGLDDDCDGLFDEDYQETNTSCGFSECARTGLLQCINGTEIDSCVAEPAFETEIDCDNQHDDDCDGLYDCEDSDCQQDEACDIECFDDSYCEPWPLQCMGNFCFDSDSVHQNVTRGKCELPGTVLSRCVVVWDSIVWEECYPGTCVGDLPNAHCVDNFCDDDSECGSSQLLNNYCNGTDLYSNYTSPVCDGICYIQFNQVLNQTNSSMCLPDECEVNEDCPGALSEINCIADNLINITRIPYCLSGRCGLNEINTTIIDGCKNDTNETNNNPVVTLINPANNHETSFSSIDFIYNVNDEDNIGNCSLKINGIIVSIDSSITKNIEQMFTRTLEYGDYTWQIICYDDSSYGESGIRNLKIFEDDDDDSCSGSGCGGGSTTLISAARGCGDGICDSTENYRTCSLDCLAPSYNMNGLGYQNYSVIDLSTSKKPSYSLWWLWLLISLILLLLLLLLILLAKRR